MTENENGISGKSGTGDSHYTPDEIRRIKEAEKSRMEKDASGTVREWLLNQPLTDQFAPDNIRYIHDFVQGIAHLDTHASGLYLDYAAGSGWAGHWLNLLGFKTIILDISLDMLKIAQERTGHLEFAMLVAADVEALPFKNNSFDGIICLNAFHHIPGPLEALKEMHRVLLESGSAVLFEPGEGHSEDPRSQYDVQKLGVLEQDVLIQEIAQLAAKAGFGKCLTGIYTFPFTLMQWEQWVELKKGKISGFDQDSELHNQLNAFDEHIRRHPYLKLVKAEYAFSRKPDRLSCDIRISEAPDTIPSGFVFRVDVHIINTGNTIWFASSPNDYGTVKLGAHLCDSKDEILEFEYGRSELLHDMSPGDCSDIAIFLRAPDGPGDWKVQFDMLAEGIDWFGNRGNTIREITLKTIESDTIQIFDSFIPDKLEGSLEPLGPLTLETYQGHPQLLLVKCFNKGNSTWLSAAHHEKGLVTIRITVKEYGSRIIAEHSPAGIIFRDVKPGEESVIATAFPAPEFEGDYTVIPELVVDQTRAIQSQQGDRLIYAMSVREPVCSSADRNIKGLFSENPLLPGFHANLALWFEKNDILKAAGEEWAIAAWLDPLVSTFQDHCIKLSLEQEPYMVKELGVDLSPEKFIPVRTFPGVKGLPLFLSGVDFPMDPCTPGEDIEIHLFWKTNDLIQCDYTCFVHFYQSDSGNSNLFSRFIKRNLFNNRLFFQKDFQMGGHAWPTSSWHMDSTVIDKIKVHVPSTIKPGTYFAAIGIWVPGERKGRIMFLDQPDALQSSKISTLTLIVKE